MDLAKGVEIDTVPYPAVNRCTVNDGNYGVPFLICILGVLWIFSKSCLVQ